MVTPAPTSLLLYSTNPWLKYYLNEEYRGRRHYVWCSEYFDSEMLGRLDYRTLVPPTSTPRAIFEDLKTAVLRGDQHNARIQGWKASLPALAIEWAAAGEISDDAKEEIVFHANGTNPNVWRPLLYVIPAAPVRDRARLVAPAHRAGIGPEYIIEDLHRSEFDILEF